MPAAFAAIALITPIYSSNPVHEPVHDFYAVVGCW
jgi:hypothetical protein